MRPGMDDAPRHQEALMHLLQGFTCVAFALVILAGGADAIPVDGKLDPQYGGSLSTQTTQTSRGDGAEYFASELDEAFGYVADDTLHLLLGGSYNRFRSEPLVLPNQLQLYIDTGPGGQNPLSGSNPSVGHNVNLQDMTGMRFDDEFSPDFWLAAARETFNGLGAHFAELPTGGGGVGHYLGASMIGDPGTLIGGFNPFGVLASVDISNNAGVTAGCEAASGAGVTTGIEWAIPLAAIGNPTEVIRVCALISSVGAEGQVSNQVLGPVPPGTCALGSASGVDFRNLAGAQYFMVAAKVTSVTKPSWGRVKALYR